MSFNNTLKVGLTHVPVKSHNRDRLRTPLPFIHSTCRYHGSAVHMELRFMLALIIIVQDMVERELHDKQQLVLDTMWSSVCTTASLVRLATTCALVRLSRKSNSDLRKRVDK